MRRGWQTRLLGVVVALAGGPLAWAADLQITELSDTGYDPSPVGAELVYSVRIENAASDDARDTVVLFDLPAGTALAASAPSHCSVLPGSASFQRVLCRNPAVLNASTGPYAFTLPVTTLQRAVGTLQLMAAAGYASALPAVDVELASLDLAADAFFGNDTNRSNNRLIQDTTLTESTDLRLSKTATPSPVLGGGALTYTLTVTNQGPSEARGFTVTDTLDANTALVAGSASGAGWVFSGANGSYSGNLAVGASASYQYRAKVNIGSGNVSNGAVVATGADKAPDTNPDNNTAHVTTPVLPGADLSLHKSATPAPAPAGATIAFTLTARNDGPSLASSVVVTDTLPTGFSVLSATADQGTCNTVNGTLTCQIGTLTAGQQTQVVVQAQVPASGPNSQGSVTNSATISSSTDDPVLTNNTGAVTFNVLADGADLLMGKRKSPARVAAWPHSGSASDSVITSVLTVTNQGPRAVEGNLQVADTLAVGEQWVDANGTPYAANVAVALNGGWSCMTPAAYVDGLRQQVICDLTGSYPVATGAARSVSLRTLALKSGQLTNEVCTGGAGGTLAPLTAGGVNRDPDLGNNCAGAGVVATQQAADLSISKQTNGSGAADNLVSAQDDYVDFTLEVTNNGAPTPGVVVNDPLPGFVSGKTRVEALSNPAGWTCALQTSAWNCRSGSTVLGTNQSVTIAFRVHRGLFDSLSQAAHSCAGVRQPAGRFCNIAQVQVDTAQAGALGEVDKTNNSASDWLLIEPVANVVTAAKNITSGSPGRAGVETDYTISYRNDGPSAVTDVVFRDVFTLPANDAGFVLLSARRSGGTGATCVVSERDSGIIASPASGGTSYRNDSTAAATLSVTCPRIALSNGQGETLIIKVRPNVNAGNTGRQFENTADFFFDFDGNGQPDASSGTLPSGADFDYNRRGDDDSQLATLPFEAGTVDLLVNKEDSRFAGAVDPLGFDSRPGMEVNNRILYRISVLNQGPSLATGVIITDTLTPPSSAQVRLVGTRTGNRDTPLGPLVLMTDAGARCQLVSGSNPNVQGQSQTVQCQMPSVGTGMIGEGQIPSSQTSYLYLVYEYVTAPPATGETLVNSVTASGNETETNPANNTAGQTTSIRTRTDLEVIKQLSTTLPDTDPSVAVQAASEAALYQPVWYVLDVQNKGPGHSRSINRSAQSRLAGTGTVITDTLVAGLELMPGAQASWRKIDSVAGSTETDLTASGTGTCATAGKTLTCQLGDLALDGRARVLIPARWVSYPVNGQGSNQVSLRTEQIDPTPGNDNSIVTNTITRSSLAGVVFVDSDRSSGNGGIQQAGEAGLAGIRLTLGGIDLWGNPVNLSTITDSDGRYRFTDLAPSDAAGYTLTQSQPASHVNGPVAPPSSGALAPSAGGAHERGGSSADSRYTAIVLAAATQAVRYDFPEVRRPGLSGVVYVDVDFNDIYGSGNDTPIAGATVDLLDAADGSVIATTTTDPSGAYRFNSLDPEITYTLREVLPNGGYRNRPSAITPGTINGQPCAAASCVTGSGLAGDAPSTDRISTIDLSAGFDGINFNFGEDAITSISGSVYLDRNDNGNFERSGGDAAIKDVVVILKDDNGTEVARTLTDVDGNYRFVDLVVGSNYTVVQQQPSGYASGQQSPATEIAINNLPQAGSHNNNFGETLGSLAGIVFADFSANAASNNNGVFDAGEQPIAGVSVTLTGTDLNGNPVNRTTTTAADGSYRFDDLMPAGAAGYVLTETQPAGYLDGKHTAGNGVAAGSTAQANVVSAINISAGQQASGYLFGEQANATISGTVYLDRDDDGDQQAGTEPGIPGVTITIEGAGPDGVFGTPDDTEEAVTTDADGNYRYGGAVAGQDYRIVQTQPGGLADGQENGTAVPTPGIITISNLPSTGSADNHFGELAASLAGAVYLDSNNNGVRDAGEPALAGVQVSLPAGTRDALGKPVASATTAADGSYRFDDLLAGSYTVTQQAAQPVHNGITTINGATSAGSIDGVRSGTASAVDSVPSSIGGIVLPAGKQAVDNDFAEILPVAAAGTVFFDVDNDGAMAGVAETGIGAVQITLTGTDDLGNAVNLSTTTATDGTFSFEGLRPGSYSLTEPTQPTGTANGITTAGNVGGTGSGTATPVTTLPSAIASIDLATPGSRSQGNLFGELPSNSGITGVVWEDRNNDGVVDPGEPGLPGVDVVLTGTDIQGNPVAPLTVVTDANGEYRFTNLPPGSYSVTESKQPAGTADGQTVPGSTGGNGSIAGSATDGNPSTITAITVGVGQVSQDNNFGEIPAGSISGKVYNDGNDNGIAENDEGGYAGIVIDLVGTDDLGNPVSLGTTTDADGNYRFDDLRPGTYSVTQTQQPAETLNGITTAGSIGGSSVGVATGTDTVPSAISQIVLPIGGESIHNNFGEIGDSSDIQVSKSLDSAKLTVNNRSTYTISVRNAGRKPSQGEYVVEDRLPVGITLAAVPSGEGWTCSGAVGDSRFSCRSSAPVAPGERSGAVISVPVTVAMAAADAGVVSNAVIVSGGGDSPFRTPSTVERESFEGDVTQLPECADGINHNACRLPIPAQLSASVAGTVWFDGGSEDARLDAGDKRLADWIVELVDPSTDTVVRRITTAADGSYQFNDVIPGREWNIRFRDPVSGIIWAWPVNQEQAGSNSISCDTANALANGTSSACRGSADGVSQLLVVLAPGAHLPQQSLPVDPAGVVYDAVSRDPVPGAIVTMTPVGICPAYDPALAVLNATAGGYRIEGSAISMTVGNDGFYQFIFGPGAPASCEYRLDVTPPGGYRFVSSLIAPENGALSPPGRIGENWLVQPQPTPPTVVVGEGTRYWLNVISGSGTAGIIHNHIPLDAVVAPGLVITKTGDRQIVELGDTLQYTISVRQSAGRALSMVNIVDTLPRGFSYIDGTARLGGRALADPAGAPGPRLGFALGAINVGEQLALTYRVRVGVGALQGDGINRAQAHGCSINAGCISTGAMSPLPGSIASNPAQYRVRVTGGVFATEACVLGKVFVDCNLNHVQDHEELGIPGVRLYFSDGTWLVSDVEGKYSYCGLPANSHTLKVDASTLPQGARLTTSSNRNLGDADSLLLDLKNGELHRADFIEGSCANPVLEQVRARRSQGEVRAPETEAGQPTLRFESKPLRAPQQATDSANQRPIVKPRTLESVDAPQQVQP